MRAIVVVGAGGFGREVLDVVEAINHVGRTWDIVGVADDSPSPTNLGRLKSRGVRYLGTVDEMIASAPPCSYAIAIGSPGVRRKIAERMDSAGFDAEVLVHPHATIGSQVTVSAGSVICAGARLTTNIEVGRHVHINLNATVGHDTRIGDFVSVNPLASISGDCRLEEDVLIGVAGVVLNGLKIGRGAIVGGSACVVRDVAEGATVKGVPAR